VTQGRRGSHYNVELKEFLTNIKILERFNSGSAVETIELEEKKLNLLYTTEDTINLICPKTFEEFSFSLDILNLSPKSVKLLREEMILTVSIFNEKGLSISVPLYWDYKVIETTDVNISSGNSGIIYKPVTLENDVVIQAPEFIKVGEFITVNVQNATYFSKAKK
ncbi:hypothetical protein HDU92_000930, partial [Lobulomyces angularis]